MTQTTQPNLPSPNVKALTVFPRCCTVSKKGKLIDARDEVSPDALSQMFGYFEP